MVVASVHTSRDAIIWAFDGAANLVLTATPTIAFNFKRAGCKWIVSMFLTHDAPTADVGVRLQCLSGGGVVASLTVAFDGADGAELETRRVVGHDFAQPLVTIFRRRLFDGASWLEQGLTELGLSGLSSVGLGDKDKDDGKLRLRISGLCAGWAELPAPLKSTVQELPGAGAELRLANDSSSKSSESKLEKLSENGWSRTSSVLRMASRGKQRPSAPVASATALLHLTLFAPAQLPQKVCWSVRLLDVHDSHGVACGIAHRGCNALHGAAALDACEGYTADGEPPGAPAEAARNPELEVLRLRASNFPCIRSTYMSGSRYTVTSGRGQVLLTRVCFGERVGTPLTFESREWRLTCAGLRALCACSGEPLADP
jgi:hypothetical protein